VAGRIKMTYIILDILMSWSVQFGLNLYIDYKKVAETTSYLMRNVENPKICDLYVGRPQSDGEYANMVIGCQWQEE
jgi:hypothetical protein